jgi:rare lipoprotein A
VFFLQYALVANSNQSSRKTKQSHPHSLSGHKPSKKKANSLAHPRRSGDCHKLKLCSKGSGRRNKKMVKPVLIKKDQGKVVRVSYYNLPGNLTANGERFDAAKMTAAHKNLPFNTIVQLSNPENGRSIRVRINDRGPFAGNRQFDLTPAAAKHLKMIGDGVASLQVKVIYQPSKASKA